MNSLLWRKIKGGLSWTVQSVSVRLIVERTRNPEFNAIASYSVVAEFINETGKSFKAKLPKISTQKEAEDFLKKM
jgi:DNA topoisomerase-1